MQPLSVQQIHMNCSWEIKAFSQPQLNSTQTRKLIEQAYDEVSRIQKKFTVFDKSEFNKINELAGVSPVDIDSETYQLLKQAIDFSKLSNGVFDISFASSCEEVRNFKLIELKKSSVFLPDSRMKISLGGIGKGYAVDQAFKLLRSRGLINFIVNGSGDIRCHTHSSAPRPWRLGITNPFNVKNNIGYLNLKNQALATSGVYKKGQHIKSSQRNSPISATVLSTTTQEADLWGTYLCSLSCIEALKVVDQNEIFAIIIDEKGNCYSSKKAQQAQEKKNV